MEHTTEQPRGNRRRRRWVLVAAAAAVVAVVVPLWVVLPIGQQRAAEGPMTCPATHEQPPPWVPHPPRGVDGDRLVPAQVPQRALVCAYAGQNTDTQRPWALSGTRELTGLDQLTDDLSLRSRRPEAPTACTQMAGPQVNYLIGLTYPDGTLWLSTAEDPNGCTPTSNGPFTSHGIGRQVTASYQAGRWVPRPAADPAAGPVACTTGGEGRLGQEIVMVPPGANSVEVCETGATRTGRTVTDGVTELAAALSALPTSPTGNRCQIVENAPAYYTLVFHYPSGPGVTVQLNLGCKPAVTNGNLDAPDAAPVMPHVHRMLG